MEGAAGFFEGEEVGLMRCAVVYGTAVGLVLGLWGPLGVAVAVGFWLLWDGAREVLGR